MEFQTTIEIYDEEIEIEVDFDYEPYEPMERHYPGCDESVTVYDARLITGEEICLMPDVIPAIEEQILHEKHENERWDF